MSKFQIILLAVFGAFVVIGVAVFSLYRGSSGNDVNIVVWGDTPSNYFNLLLNTSTLTQDKTLSVSYVEKSADTLEAEFTEALARGQGPDLILLTQDKLWKNKPKLLAIPFESFTERDFKTTFVEEGELFLDAAGIYALPISIDPMVLYYNRDILSSAGHAKPIVYWDEIYASAANLSKKDTAGNLFSSVIALGEARNIPHAKDILSLLFLQAGAPITVKVSGKLQAQISNNPSGLPVAPGVSAMDFYTQFSNPTKVFYSWNRSLIDAQTHFTSGDSAYYLGFASELSVLKNKNPTLNFSVAPVPQSRVSSKIITFGNIKGVAISRGSRNPAVAFTVATKLTSKESSIFLSKNLALPPARRDLLASKPTDAIFSVFYDAALQSKAWLDPNAEETDTIFRNAIESVTSGRARSGEAISEINKEVDALIK